MNIIINNPQKAESFAAIFQHIKLFTDNINLFFEKDRLYVQAMDNSRIAIFEVFIPKEWFDAYETATSSGVTVGINSSLLYRVLNAREKMQQINMVYKNEDNDKLCIHYTSESKDEFDKHFELSLLDIDSDTMNIPEMEYQAEFTVGSSNFANIINQLKTFGDNLEFNCTEDKIMLYSSSIEQGKMACEIKMDELSSFAIEEDATIKSGFSLNYLHNICLYNKLSKEVDIHLSMDYPIKIIYKLFGHDAAKMVFYLAPKIGDGSDE